MHFLRRSLPALCALTLIAYAAATASPQGQPAAATPAAAPTGAPVPVARFSVASIDALTKFVTDLGIPVPGDIKGDIEDAPFLGTGTLATDKPFGGVIVAAESQKLFPLPDCLIFAVPVVAGKATIEDLKKGGARPVEGLTDTVTSPEYVARRTTDYLFAKEPHTSTFGLSAMTDSILSAEYKQPGTLGALSLNFDLLRKAAPSAYKEVAQNLTNLPMMLFMGPGMPMPPGNADDAKPVLAVLDKIDRFSLTLSQEDKSLHLKSWLMPTPFTAKSREMPRPAFPAGVIVQMHVVYPDAAAAGFFEHQLDALSEDTLGEELGLLPVYRARAKELLLRLAKLSSTSDAFSLGVAVKDGHHVFYVVDQLSKQTDALGEFKSIITDMGALATESGAAKMNVDGSSYDASGKKVDRLVVATEGAPKVVIDGIQNGKNLYLAFSDNAEGKYVGDLAAAGMSGSSSVLCAGAIDLGALSSVMTENGGPFGITSPDKLEVLKKTFAGQGVTWTVQSSEQNFLYFDLAVPTDAVKALIKLSN